MMPDNTIPAENGPGETGTEPLPNVRGVIILEPGGEQAQKIAKAMGSQTAGDILQLLKSGPKTSTEVTDQLAIPMGTAKYHIENLLDAGLIEVTRTKYSVKGREVKVYGLRDQLLIVTPAVANVRALLLKYASLFGVVAVATVVIGAVLQVLSLSGSAPSLNAELKKSGISDLVPTALSAPFPAGTAGPHDMGLVAENGSRALNMKEMVTGMVPSPTSDAVYSQVQVQVNAPASFPLQEVLIAFFLGGCLVIAVLVLYDLARRRKRRLT